MNKRKLFSLFIDQFPDLKPSTKGWYRFNLYEGKRDQSHGVNFSLNVVKDWRSGYCTSIYSFLIKYTSSSFKQVKELESKYPEKNFIEFTGSAKYFSDKKPALKYPNYSKRLKKGKGILYRRAVKYLSDRGFDINYLDYRGFRYCNDGDYMGYIIIPVIINNKLRYFLGRDFLDRGKAVRYKNVKTEDADIGSSSILYNQDCLNHFDKVYILEGWSDAETIGINSVATFNADFSKTQLNILINSEVKDFVIVSDKGYYNHQLNNAMELVEHKRVKVLNLDKENGKDANDIGYGRVKELESKAKYLYNIVDVMELIK